MLSFSTFLMLIFPVEPKVEAIDRKAGDAIKAFKDLVFPDDYNPAGKPAPKRKVFSVWFVFCIQWHVWCKMSHLLKKLMHLINLGMDMEYFFWDWFCVYFRQEMHPGLQQKEANQEMTWKLTWEKRHRKAE